MLYAQANMPRKKFYFCSKEVKINLFRAYCTPLYTAPLWVKYKQKSIQKLQVAYNSRFKIWTEWCYGRKKTERDRRLSARYINLLAVSAQLTTPVPSL